jgi:hypothetical protein
MYLINSYKFGGGAPVISYFTDLYGVPIAAYSLRKLSPTAVYSGPAIKVRRSSDNAELDINFITSDANAGIDTAALLSFVGAGNGFITTWYNQDGSGNNATQATAVSQPIIVSGGTLLTLSGVPRIDFDGTNDFLTIPTINFAASNYQSFVGKRDASGRKLLALAGVQYLLVLQSDNKFYLINKILGYATSTATDTTTSHLIITGQRDTGGTQRIYKNNVEVPTTIVSASPFGTTINSIGRYNNSFSYVTFGSIQETIYYNTDESANRTAIETDINNYYTVF